MRRADEIQVRQSSDCGAIVFEATHKHGKSGHPTLDTVVDQKSALLEITTHTNHDNVTETGAAQQSNVEYVVLQSLELVDDNIGQQLRR